MFLRNFSSVLFVAFTCTVVSAEPKWKAPGLVKSLREADRVVERADLPPEAFADSTGVVAGKKANPQTIANAIKRKEEVISGLNHSALCAEPHTIAIAIIAITDNSDGSAQIVGTRDRDTKGRVFYSSSERERIAYWDRLWTENQAVYTDALTRYNRREQRDSLDDPAHNRSLKEREFKEMRDRELRPFHDAARERERKFAQIRFELMCPAEMAAKLDRPKILRARQVSILVHPNACELDLADPMVAVPPVISIIRGVLTDIDPAMFKKGDSKKDQSEE